MWLRWCLVIQTRHRLASARGKSGKTLRASRFFQRQSRSELAFRD